MPDRVVSKSFPFLKIRKGESNLAVDLDNEMTSIVVAENGGTKSAVALHPLVRAFYGTQSVIGDCTVTASSSDANVTVTYNTTTHCVDVSIQQNVQLSDVTTITITVAHSTYGTRVVYFVIAAVRDGIDAFIQELLPSLNEISFARQSDNSLSPSSRSLTLSFKKTKGETVTTQSISESGLTIRWSASSMPSTSSEGNSWGSGTGVSGITWSSNTMQIANSVSVSNIYIACFNSSGTLVDRETIPVIKDGVHGTSPYFQDLNNEMDAVQCEHDGSVIAAQTVSTTISMWKGSATEQFVIDNIYRNGTQLTWDTFNSGVKPRNNGSTVYLDFNTSATISNVDDFKITIHSYNDNSVTRELHFNIKGVRANAIYRLVPSHSQIVKKKNNTYEPSGNITCSVEKTENGATSTPSSSEYTLEKSVNGGSYESYSATAASSITSDLKFRLTVDGTVVDLESIPLVSDGDKGNDGDDAPVAFASPDKITIQCYNSGNVISETSTAVTFSLKVGTHAATVTSVSCDSHPTNVTIGNGSADNIKSITVPTTQTADGLAAGCVFTVTGTYDSKSFSAKVTVALFGSVQGQTGPQSTTPGPRGKVGRFFYYAGIFDDTDSTTQFVVNDAQSPYFAYNNQYWVYNPEDNPSGGTATMSAMGTPSSSSSSWEIMTNDFKYLITEAIFGRYAHFGSFIINDDWLISQHGKKNNVDSTDYTSFDPNFVKGCYLCQGVSVDVNYQNVGSNVFIGGKTYNITLIGESFRADAGVQSQKILSVRMYDGSSDVGSTVNLTSENPTQTLTFTPQSTGLYYLRADMQYGGTHGIVTAYVNNVFIPNYAIDALQGTSYQRNTYLSGRMESEDLDMGNKIIIDAETGGLKMIGPRAVNDDDRRPNGNTRQTLFDVWFDTDPDTLTRLASMILRDGSNDHFATVDPYFGVSVHDNVSGDDEYGGLGAGGVSFGSGSGNTYEGVQITKSGVTIFRGTTTTTKTWEEIFTNQ